MSDETFTRASLEDLAAELETSTRGYSSHAPVSCDVVRRCAAAIRFAAELADVAERAKAERDDALRDVSRLVQAIETYQGMLAERDALRTAARALIDALPKCYERVCEDGAMRDCGKPATRAFRRGEGRWCDEHGLRWIVGFKEPTLAPEYPRAAPLRAIAALLGAGAARDEGGAA